MQTREIPAFVELPGDRFVATEDVMRSKKLQREARWILGNELAEVLDRLRATGTDQEAADFALSIFTEVFGGTVKIKESRSRYDADAATIPY